MKKVLIISPYYSNFRGIAAVRINGLAKFLPKFGWEPYILTASSASAESSQSQINVFESPYEDLAIKLKRMLRLNENQSLKEQFHVRTQKDKQTQLDFILNIWAELFAYPDTYHSWRKPSVALGKKVIECELCDAMISSSGPPTCNLIAKDLKEKCCIPWIADFRDLWTQNHYYHFSKFRHFFERRMEIRTLSHADALTAASEPFSAKLKELHPGKMIFSITNGFDPDKKNPGSPLAKKFTISYTGTIYRGGQDPKLLFEALSNLIYEGLIDPNDLSVDFYGRKEDWLEDDTKSYGLDGIVKINGFIPRDESVEKQRRCHLLLLLTWNNKEEKGVIPAKIFEYFAAGRPILSIGATGGVVDDLLKITGAGFHPSSKEDMKRIIMNAYNEYKSKNTVTYHGLPSEIDKFSHIEMARKFSAVLDDLVEAKK